MAPKIEKIPNELAPILSPTEKVRFYAKSWSKTDPINQIYIKSTKIITYLQTMNENLEILFKLRHERACLDNVKCLLIYEYFILRKKLLVNQKCAKIVIAQNWTIHYCLTYI